MISTVFSGVYEVEESINPLIPIQSIPLWIHPSSRTWAINSNPLFSLTLRSHTPGLASTHSSSYKVYPYFDTKVSKYQVRTKAMKVNSSIVSNNSRGPGKMHNMSTATHLLATYLLTYLLYHQHQGGGMGWTGETPMQHATCNMATWNTMQMQMIL